MKKIIPANSEFMTPQMLENELGISISKQSKLRMKRAQNQPNPSPFITQGKLIVYPRSSVYSWFNSLARGL